MFPSDHVPQGAVHTWLKAGKPVIIFNRKQQ